MEINVLCLLSVIILGLDISSTAVEICKKKLQNNSSYKFDVYNEQYKNNNIYDLALSLDVIYHILDHQNYKKYMTDLFKFSKKYVIIYSNNYNGVQCGHMHERQFTSDLDVWFPEWNLKEFIKQKYPHKSSADFYIYEKRD